MSGFFSKKSVNIPSNMTRRIQKSVSKVRSTIGLPESHQEQQHTIQKISMSAVNKYTNQYKQFIDAIEYLHTHDINYSILRKYQTEYDEVYEKMKIIHIEFPKLILKLKKTFTHCKSECARLKPELKDDLERLARESPYAYVNTCKSLAIIDDCFKFTALLSLFEIPLKKLYKKINSVAHSKDHNGIELKATVEMFIRKFIKDYYEFVNLTGTKIGGVKNRNATLKQKNKKHIRKTYKYKK